MANPIDHSCEVLIVGAGPTGLMLACQLARFGISHRIVEKNSGPTTQSRALAIQARSLELFAQLGIAQQAVEQGKRAKAVNYVARGKLAQRISLEGHGESLTAFPYLLILDQSRTEQLLIDFLVQHDHSVEWQTELVSFTQNSQGVLATLQHWNGTQEQVQAAWLVGADGAKSVVRRILDIPFGGKTYQYSLFVLDCKVDLPFKDDEGYIAFSDTSFAAFFPMTEGRCRVISMLPEERADKEQVTFDDVTKGFAERMQMDVKLSDPKWLSVYHSHHRSVATFRKGRCFLAGDAAHVHSPVGAQGMNTGLQDAHNLAWKLAMVISGQAQQSVLDTYDEERLPIAKSLVRTTDRVFNLTLNTNPVVRFWIMYVAPKALALVVNEKHLARLAFTTISQIGIRYRTSSLSQQASLGAFPRHAPQPEDRLPYVLFHEQGKHVNIQDKVKAPAFHLFFFPGTQSGARAQALQQAADTFDGAIVVETIPLTVETRPLYQALGVPRGGCYLVRPDMYIAYRSAAWNAEHFALYLERFLITTAQRRTSSSERVQAACDTPRTHANAGPPTPVEQ
jgi:2-polyprenyl-6-methoxyphenol hydroxylase-like FAD-dependent oxidoreductase